MNPTIKEQWINALQSDEWKQGKGSLHPTEDTYCCLGVLTDLYCKEQKLDENQRRGLLCYCTLPTLVKEWAELDQCDPEIGPLDGRPSCRIATANDGFNDAYGYEVVRPRTFPEIAEIIKQRL